MANWILISRPWIERFIELAQDILMDSQELDPAHLPETEREIMRAAIGFIWQVLGVLRYRLTEDDDLDLELGENQIDNIINLFDSDTE